MSLFLLDTNLLNLVLESVRRFIVSSAEVQVINVFQYPSWNREYSTLKGE